MPKLVFNDLFLKQADHLIATGHCIKNERRCDSYGGCFYLCFYDIVPADAGYDGCENKRIATAVKYKRLYEMSELLQQEVKV